MGILPSNSRVGTNEWLHQFDFNGTLDKKAWWKLHKNAALCSEQILEVEIL